MTEDEMEQCGLTDDIDDEIGYHSGTKFKKMKCNLNDVEENTVKGEEK